MLWKCNFFRIVPIFSGKLKEERNLLMSNWRKKFYVSAFTYCFGNLFAWWYVLTSTKAHHRLLDAILSRFLQMDPVLSIKQTICSMMKRQFPTNVVYIQPLCSWFKCEIGMTNVATMTTAMIRIWKKQKCIIDLKLSSRRCCCSHWRNFP